MILIGTSGYSFPDWRGSFYPDGLPDRKQLPYYAEHFSTVEINTSFYRLPNERLFEGMQKRVPQGFLFWVKVFRGLTHEEGFDRNELKQMFRSVTPLQEAGQLAGLLAQFPWSFRNSVSSWDRVRQLADAAAGRPFAVEFRHSSWDRPELYEKLRQQGITYCIVDEPQMSELMPPTIQITSPIAYFRLHGRNQKTWWGKNPSLRYDYLYSEQELARWGSEIKAADAQARKVFVFFNNCHAGQAAKNAQMLREMLGQPLPSGRLF